ncbi:MAG TPA: hypothetical protein VM432_12075 [Bdellovibrionales bacterium]|nr:hypothetical protein [Bdellovibrionales bacterium]
MDKQNIDRKKSIEIAEDLARENAAQTSNGNRETTDSEKLGGAQRGGPGTSHAKEKQPPGATRPQRPSE